jgi:hypothetical protein
VADDRALARTKERWLAYAAASGFVLLLVLATLLWLREGTIVYLARVISEIPNCL